MELIEYFSIMLTNIRQKKKKKKEKLMQTLKYLLDVIFFGHCKLVKNINMSGREFESPNAHTCEFESPMHLKNKAYCFLFYFILNGIL